MKYGAFIEANDSAAIVGSMPGESNDGIYILISFKSRRILIAQITNAMENMARRMTNRTLKNLDLSPFTLQSLLVWCKSKT